MVHVRPIAFSSIITENIVVGHFYDKFSAKNLALSERLRILGSIFRSQLLIFLCPLGSISAI